MTGMCGMELNLSFVFVSFDMMVCSFPGRLISKEEEEENVQQMFHSARARDVKPPSPQTVLCSLRSLSKMLRNSRESLSVRQVHCNHDDDTSVPRPLFSSPPNGFRWSER